MATPRNPLIRIEFDASGAVRHAEAIESSGNSNIDGPILDAIYRWTAEGAALEALKSEGSDRTVAIEMRILL